MKVREGNFRYTRGLWDDFSQNEDEAGVNSAFLFSQNPEKLLIEIE